MGVETWNSAPEESGSQPDSTSAASPWQQDEGNAATDGWKSDAAGSGTELARDFSPENISKHAASDDKPRDGGCRNCGEDGHFARDCPEPARSRPARACFSCGSTEHVKADCPVEKPRTCKICKETGHESSSCTSNRIWIEFRNFGLDEDISGDEAWKLLLEADGEKDVDDIKKALIAYAKAVPDLTFPEMETSFRDTNMNTFLIAVAKEVADTHTIVNLQGQGDQKFAVSIHFSAAPRRAAAKESWPANPQENLNRLAEAGFIMDRLVPKCSNCDQLGHGARGCPEEKITREKAVIQCFNCDGEGHWARDCDQPRRQRGGGSKACRICGENDHLAADCPEKAAGGGSMTCRKCDGEGHRASECDQPRNMAKVQCRNCDEYGHVGKECPRPRDWSRMTCQQCGEKGHGVKRCPNPPKETDEVGDDANGWDDGGAKLSSGGSGQQDSGTASVGGNWGGATAASNGW